MATLASAPLSVQASSLAGATIASAESTDFDFGAVCGRPSLWLAPMVGQSEPAFRMLCRKYGATLCTTPMIDPAGYVRSERWAQRNLHDRRLLASYAVTPFLGTWTCSRLPCTMLLVARTPLTDPHALSPTSTRPIVASPQVP